MPEPPAVPFRSPGPEEYRTLVEQAPILIWRSGRDMLCDYFNERWLEYTGRSMEEELGNGWTEGVHRDDFDRCLEIYTGHFRRRDAFEMEYRLRRHDGAYRWIFDRGVPFEVDGEFGGYIGSCIDIHEGVTAREELERRRLLELERLRRLLPICAWCGRLRDDEGYWHVVGEYVSELGLGRPTHGICDGCAEELGSAPDGVAGEPAEV